MADIGDEILRRLRGVYEISPDDFVSLQAYLRSGSPFEVLVATILSQNTTDTSAMRAFNNLASTIPVTPTSLYKAGVRLISRAIKPAGIYRVKARHLWRLSKIIVEMNGGDFEEILRGDPHLVRERLKSLPGVGDKTADILLTVFGIMERLPIDTHVYRVSSRLGLIKAGMGYEEAHDLLVRTFREGSRHEAHLLLITHGRRTCKAKSPQCTRCVLRDLCAYYLARRAGPRHNQK